MITPIEQAQRTYGGPVSDSTRWSAFEPRVGDIIVNTPPKAGTTWTQGILAMLIAGDPAVDAQTAFKSPWIDFNRRSVQEVMDRLAAQTHRRQVKSHTPFDGLPYWDELRYITVYRHPIDIHFSFRNHVRNMKLDVFDGANTTDPGESFQVFLTADSAEDATLRAIVTHYRETLKRSQRDNLIRLHYADMLRDLSGHVARIADHVGIRLAPACEAAIVEAATFEQMQANADRFAPSAGQGFWHKDVAFFHSASCNKWEGQLTDADLDAYDQAISALISPAERAWLEWGTVDA